MSDQDHDPPSGKALERGRRAPPMKVAANLQVASSQDLVHVDGRGRVRSPARLKVLQLGSYGALGAMVAASTALNYQLIGNPGLGLGAAVGAWAAYLVSHTLTLRQGLRYSAAGLYEEAAARYSRVARGRIVPRKMRAMAEQNLAVLRNLDGQHEEALALFQSAIARWRGSRTVMPVMARYGAVFTLVHLDRLAEARAGLAALAPIPEGEYLKVHHWTVELYLCLAEGTHPFAEEELYQRSRAALAITSAAGLLGLLAWAYARLGDGAMSQHLRDECLDRHPGARLSRGLPRLQRWLDTRSSVGGVDPVLVP
jgi:tetratricopeptide (TPR) repeat protein